MRLLRFVFFKNTEDRWEQSCWKDRTPDTYILGGKHQLIQQRQESRHLSFTCEAARL